MDKFQFGPAAEEQRTTLRKDPVRCVKILRACKPLANQLAATSGIYTELTPEEEHLLQEFHWIADAHQGYEYEGAFHGLCSRAGLLHSDVGLLEGRLRIFYQQREPVQYQAETIALIHQWMQDGEQRH